MTIQVWTYVHVHAHLHVHTQCIWNIKSSTLYSRCTCDTVHVAGCFYTVTNWSNLIDYMHCGITCMYMPCTYMYSLHLLQCVHTLGSKYYMYSTCLLPFERWYQLINYALTVCLVLSYILFRGINLLSTLPCYAKVSPLHWSPCKDDLVNPIHVGGARGS